MRIKICMFPTRDDPPNKQSGQKPAPWSECLLHFLFHSLVPPLQCPTPDSRLGYRVAHLISSEHLFVSTMSMRRSLAFPEASAMDLPPPQSDYPTNSDPTASHHSQPRSVVSLSTTFDNGYPYGLARPSNGSGTTRPPPKYMGRQSGAMRKQSSSRIMKRDERKKVSRACDSCKT
jgi:hypothetical protein